MKKFSRYLVLIFINCYVFSYAGAPPCPTCGGSGGGEGTTGPGKPASPIDMYIPIVIFFAICLIILYTKKRKIKFN